MSFPQVYWFFLAGSFQFIILAVLFLLLTQNQVLKNLFKKATIIAYKMYKPRLEILEALDMRTPTKNY